MTHCDKCKGKYGANSKICSSPRCTCHQTEPPCKHIDECYKDGFCMMCGAKTESTETSGTETNVKNMEEEIEFELSIVNYIAKKPDDIFKVLAYAMRGLEEYKKNLTAKNANIDLIVRNLKPEHYEELKKYVIPEVFESLGLQDAIKVVEKSAP